MKDLIKKNTSDIKKVPSFFGLTVITNDYFY